MLGWVRFIYALEPLMWYVRGGLKYDHSHKARQNRPKEELHSQEIQIARCR